jgi:hypothetical protein
MVKVVSVWRLLAFGMMVTVAVAVSGKRYQ